MLRILLGAGLLIALALVAIPGATASCSTDVRVAGQELASDCTETGYVVDDGYYCYWSHRTVEVANVPVLVLSSYSGDGPCWSYNCIDFLVYYDTSPVRAGAGCQ